MTRFHLGIFDIKFWQEDLATDQFNKQFIDVIRTGKKRLQKWREEITKKQKSITV